MKAINKTKPKYQPKKKTVSKTSPTRRKAVRNTQTNTISAKARAAWTNALEQRHKQIIVLLTVATALFILNTIILISLFIVEFS